jgi:hypothetical protein
MGPMGRSKLISSFRKRAGANRLFVSDYISEACNAPRGTFTCPLASLTMRIGDDIDTPCLTGAKLSERQGGRVHFIYAL